MRHLVGGGIELPNQPPSPLSRPPPRGLSLLRIDDSGGYQPPPPIASSRETRVLAAAATGVLEVRLVSPHRPLPPSSPLLAQVLHARRGRGSKLRICCYDLVSCVFLFPYAMDSASLELHVARRRG